jgi:hypothetical protein
MNYGRGPLGRIVPTFEIVSEDICVTSAIGRGADGRIVPTFEIATLVAITAVSVTSNARKRFAVDVMVLPLCLCG